MKQMRIELQDIPVENRMKQLLLGLLMLSVFMLVKMKVLDFLWFLTILQVVFFSISMIKPSFINKGMKKRTEVFYWLGIPLLGFVTAVLLLR
jgi:hypothetical protein